MSPSDLSGMTAFDDAVATAQASRVAALPDAPLAMPDQRLEPVRPLEALRAFLAPPRRRAEP